MPLKKSDAVLRMEHLAREQSAMELMAQGVITFEMTPRQQAAYDDAVRFAATIDARERQHYRELPARIAAENRQVMADLNAGKLYLVNSVGTSSPVVHFASCATVRHQVDRDVAHEMEQDQVGEIHGSWHSGTGFDGVAKWPNLLTLDEVEALRSYRACLRCNPDTKERRKTAARNPQPSKLTSVNADRIGREYETVTGEYLGMLRSYTVTKTEITLSCSEREHRGRHDSLIVMLPREAPHPRATTTTDQPQAADGLN